MDPLSEVLSLLETRDSYFIGLRAGGDWAVALPPPDGIKFNAVVEGSCWLSVDGAGPPVRLHAGDCFLLASPRAFTLASDPSVTPMAVADVYRNIERGIAHYGEPVNCFLIGGRFSYDEGMPLLLGSLPPVVVVNGDSGQAQVLRWALQQLADEFGASSPGASLMVRHLGHMMLVQILRRYMDGGANGEVGWLAGFADARVSAALAAIHAAPAQRWTVDALAACCHVSRSTFALHFKRRLGFGPLEYVLRWRMQLAMRELRRSSAPISAVAQMLGYDSDSAFGHAFKRIVGCAPSTYRHERANGAGA
ncbi:AraC family transcriptional regulator [Burkholderia ambifaria]|uniref:AraC family transcriptional regulator n=1 Tax=Burkholderia ambifaria TaxID=152480 RepID=A0AA41E4I3_9BURK|nr:AraC family transcriptional regulator [Burkholderia ambifaria]MBR8128295.1 AraC family transcriptional regulator [Burkholderia ambifaria]PRD99263.1 AraC family transcriptional regulator [Burkholderia ambifaria]UEP53052.1 AraC family transcriptional regulator [Burkholderia ambifaria]